MIMLVSWLVCGLYKMPDSSSVFFLNWIFISVKTSHIYDYCAGAVAAVPTMTQE